MRAFCFNDEVESFALAFGENSCQFSRPVAHSIINELEFVYISNDLHKIEEFSKESHLLRTLSIGNRNWKLFNTAKVEQMRGLELPADSLENDKANLRTLVNLMKKSRNLKLNRINVTHEVLEILVANTQEFPMLKGLEIEVDASFAELQEKIGGAGFSAQLERLVLN